MGDATHSSASSNREQKAEIGRCLHPHLERAIVNLNPCQESSLENHQETQHLSRLLFLQKTSSHHQHCRIPDEQPGLLLPAFLLKINGQKALVKASLIWCSDHVKCQVSWVD